jgi:benzoylformate decarboxylase
LMRDVGADAVFGNPGSTEMPMFRDFPSDFQYVLGLHEAVVVGMADGYAQARNNAAFVNLHSAAGVGNAMGNIHTAFKNRTPLVIIAGQQSRAILPFDPYLASSQATELPKPYVKWSIEPARAEDVPMAIARAYYIAMQAPRGPVLVSVPADDWDRPAAPIAVRTVSRAARPEPAVLDLIGRNLNASARPAFVVGAETDRDGAWDEVVKLAELHRASVYVAPFSGRCGFPEDHRLFMGFLPAAREQIVTRLEGHDLVLAIGAPVFTYHIEGQGPHLPAGATLCQLTEDPDSAAWAPVGTSLVASVRLALQDLLAREAPPKRPLPLARAAAPRAEASDPLTVAYVLQTLAELRKPEDIIVEEAPTARIVMHSYLPILRSGTFYTMASGGLGYGMPAAAGIALARRGERVICVIGDGSSMYSIQTLWNAAQLNLDITYIVLNNRKYAALKRFAGILGFPPDAALQGTDLPGLDFVSLARGHGCGAERIIDAKNLRSAMEAALRSTGPMLLEVVVA